MNNVKDLINAGLINRTIVTGKDYDIWDIKLTGFVLRVRKNGNMFYSH